MYKRNEWIMGTELKDVLDPAREEEEIRRLETEERREAKKVLVEHNLRLVIRIAVNFQNTGTAKEELFSVGALGLVKAVDTFDAKHQHKFYAYISRCIENEILTSLRREKKPQSDWSLDAMMENDGYIHRLFLFGVFSAEEDKLTKRLDDALMADMLKRAVRKLPDREQNMICFRYGLNESRGMVRTQKETARKFGVSQSYLSRWERKILNKLKNELQKNP